MIGASRVTLGKERKILRIGTNNFTLQHDTYDLLQQISATSCLL